MAVLLMGAAFTNLSLATSNLHEPSVDEVQEVLHDEDSAIQDLIDRLSRRRQPNTPTTLQTSVTSPVSPNPVQVG